MHIGVISKTFDAYTVRPSRRKPLWFGTGHEKKVVESHLLGLSGFTQDFMMKFVAVPSSRAAAPMHQARVSTPSICPSAAGTQTATCLTPRRFPYADMPRLLPSIRRPRKGRGVLHVAHRRGAFSGTVPALPRLPGRAAASALRSAPRRARADVVPAHVGGAPRRQGTGETSRRSG